MKRSYLLERLKAGEVKIGRYFVPEKCELIDKKRLELAESEYGVEYKEFLQEQFEKENDEDSEDEEDYDQIKSEEIKNEFLDTLEELSDDNGDIDSETYKLLCEKYNIKVLKLPALEKAQININKKNDKDENIKTVVKIKHNTISGNNTIIITKYNKENLNNLINSSGKGRPKKYNKEKVEFKDFLNFRKRIYDNYNIAFNCIRLNKFNVVLIAKRNTLDENEMKKVTHRIGCSFIKIKFYEENIGVDLNGSIDNREKGHFYLLALNIDKKRYNLLENRLKNGKIKYSFLQNKIENEKTYINKHEKKILIKALRTYRKDTLSFVEKSLKNNNEIGVEICAYGKILTMSKDIKYDKHIKYKEDEIILTNGIFDIDTGDNIYNIKSEFNKGSSEVRLKNIYLYKHVSIRDNLENSIREFALEMIKFEHKEYVLNTNVNMQIKVKEIYSNIFQIEVYIDGIELYLFEKDIMT